MSYNVFIYLGNEGVTSHNQSEARRSRGEIYCLGGNQSVKLGTKFVILV